MVKYICFVSNQKNVQVCFFFFKCDGVTHCQDLIHEVAYLLKYGK